MHRTLLPLLPLLLAGCTDLEEALDFAPPEVAVTGVELADAPSASELLGYACVQALDESLCSTVLPTPAKEDLAFSFDVLFELTNPNSVPIPLIETLIAFSAFGDENVGTACVQFCDPSEPDCEPVVNGEGGCEPAPGVTDTGDLVPTVDELIDFVQDPSLDGDWLFLAPNTTTPSELRFELGIDPLLAIAGALVSQAVSDVFSGKAPTFTVPYAIEGTLFFDVPLLGRRGVPFGPVAGEWTL